MDECMEILFMELGNACDGSPRSTKKLVTKADMLYINGSNTSTSSFFIELDERPERSHPIEKRFELVGGGVESRQWLVDDFVKDGLDDDYINDYKNDVRGENVVQIVIKAPHGLLRILWFGLADWENSEHTNIETLTETDIGRYQTILARRSGRCNRRRRQMQEDDDPKWRKVFIDSRMADKLVKEMEAGFSNAELDGSNTPSASTTLTLEHRAKEAQRRKAKKQRQKERRRFNQTQGDTTSPKAKDEAIIEEID